MNAAERIAFLESRIKELEGALGPFAEEGLAWSDPRTEDGVCPRMDGARASFTVGDLRRAARVMKEGKYMVKRYDVSWSPGGYQMVEGDDFVMADDYDAIEAENAKLRELLRRAWDCTHSATLLVDMRKELLTLRPEIKAALEPSGDSGEGKP